MRFADGRSRFGSSFDQLTDFEFRFAFVTAVTDITALILIWKLRRGWRLDGEGVVMRAASDEGEANFLLAAQADDCVTDCAGGAGNCDCDL